jgi:hypothetical protein
LNKETREQHRSSQRHPRGIRAVAKNHGTESPTQLNNGGDRWGREPTLTFLVLSSHILFFSGA